MMKIYKYEIPIEGLEPIGDAARSWVDMPREATILSVESQYNKPVVYALVNPSKSKITRPFIICGTGFHLPCRMEGLKFIGTVMLDNETLVLHIFEPVDA
jgi:hypothetical protein